MPRCKMSFGCALSLVVFLGAGMLAAQTGGAMLYSNGNVTVNGQPAGVSTAVFSGDKVAVPAGSAGSINLAGSSVVVTPNSSVQYAATSIDLIEGGARVSTNKGMTASVGQVVVSPADAAAKFDVVKTGDKVMVISREGSLNVQDGSHTTTVPAGGSAELSLAASGNQPAVQNSASAAPASDFLASNRLSQHPFYGVLKGVENNPPSLPICANITSCLRPSVSLTRPCCCPPVVLCQ